MPQFVAETALSFNNVFLAFHEASSAHAAAAYGVPCGSPETLRLVPLSDGLCPEELAELPVITAAALGVAFALFDGDVRTDLLAQHIHLCVAREECLPSTTDESPTVAHVRRRGCVQLMSLDVFYFLQVRSTHVCRAEQCKTRASQPLRCHTVVVLLDACVCVVDLLLPSTCSSRSSSS